MGASDSTLLGGQEKGGGDVITTISQRCERVDPILENLKSLTISRPILKTAPPTESSLTDILVRKALSSSSSSYTVDPQILVELFSIYREWQDSKAEDITNRQVELGELKGRLTEVINNCDILCKRINAEGPQSLRSTVTPFTLVPPDSVSINTTTTMSSEKEE